MQITDAMKSKEDEIKGRRWNWMGHILRKEQIDNSRVALAWWSEERRKQDGPETYEEEQHRMNAIKRVERAGPLSSTSSQG